MGVNRRGKTLTIDFRCYLPDNSKTRCRESEGPDNEKNRKRVQKKWKAIQYHLDQNTFKYLDFFPHGSKARYFVKPASLMTLADFWKEWLKGTTVRESTAYGYEGNYKNHIKPYFGSWKLPSITAHEIKVYRKTEIDKGHKASTVNGYVKLLCQLLKDAYSQKLIDAYPCSEFKKLTEVKPTMNPFSFAELRGWLEYLQKKDPEWYDMILIWSRTGLRPGEFYALHWDNVDIFNKQIEITRNVTYQGTIGPPKTEYSQRVIDLRPAVVEAFKRQQARTMLMDTRVFLNAKKNVWNHTSFRDAFKYRLKLAGLKVRPPKQMRHTFATLHIGAGESISWVSKVMGHGSVEVTLSRYTKFIPNLTRDDGSAFENVLNGHILATRPSKSLE